MGEKSQRPTYLEQQLQYPERLHPVNSLAREVLLRLIKNALYGGRIVMSENGLIQIANK